MNYLKHPFRAPRAFSPVTAANAFERTGGFAVFALPSLCLQAMRAAWLPFAVALTLMLALLTPSGLALGAMVGITTAGAQSAGFLGAVIAFLFASVLLASVAYRHGDGRLHAPTLTVQQLLLDVIGAFVKRFPAINMFGTQWSGAVLKLNKKYTAHVAVFGSASTYVEGSGGYANGANTARNGLKDVSIVTNVQPTYPLLWSHLDEIKDDKRQYAKVMAGGGYTLGKSCIDNGFFAKMTTRYFSKEVVLAVADCDYDWLQSLTTQGNTQGMEPEGRVLFVNSAVAQVLAVDPRMVSKDYAGQLLDGQGYRQWKNVGGFALIQEYPDLPSNNATALTGVAAEADDDLFTKAAHGLVTGDPVTVTSITGGTGVTAGTRYWVIKASADTFKLATTYANAVAGTGINITVDGSAGVITPSENLVAFMADGRAFGSLAGVPEGLNANAAMIGVVQTMTFDTIKDPDSGVTMAAAKWQEPGTGKVYWVPTFVYGTNAGKEGDTAVATNTAAQNAILAAAQAAGEGTDYAGIRCVSGA
jgi:hypothetical protein